jgi:agmatine/peptidylarginine deiminase
MSGGIDGGMRLPAEWEPQSGVLVAWPHEGTDWASDLAAVEDAYVGLVGAIARFTTAIVVVADDALRRRAASLLGAAGIAPRPIRFVTAEYDDTWLRDSGPITLRRSDGDFDLLDFAFTGWGGKFGASRDDRLVAALVAQGLFRNAAHRRIDFALEGGAIESDGAGTILTTWQCLAQRHPGRSRDALAAFLRDALAAERVLGLESGHLEGDDTDAHIDTLARFAPGDAIVHQACDDRADAHFGPLAAMADELAALETADGRRYRLHALPWPRPIHAADGRRLAASYANYLVTDGAVLVPAYGDPADALAADVIARAHPGRVAVSVPCRPFIEQNGSLHCLTMQLPEGVLADA